MKTTLVVLPHAIHPTVVPLYDAQLVFFLACDPSECDHQNAGCLEKPSVPCTKQYG